MTTADAELAQSGGGVRRTGSPSADARGTQTPRADARLLVPVVGAWSAAGFVLLDPRHRWLVVLALAGGLAGALLPRFVAGSRRSRAARSPAARVVAVGCAAGAAVAVVAALHVSNARSGPLARAAASRAYVVLEAVVSDDPRRAQTPTSRGAARTFLVVRASARSVALDGRRWQIRQPTLLIAPDTPQWRGLLPSQRVRVAGAAEPPRGHDVLAAVVAVRGPPELEGRPSRLQRLAGVVRAGLQRATTGIRQPVGGLVPGLVDGDTSRLDPVLAADFRTAGMTHLVAVSGDKVRGRDVCRATRDSTRLSASPLVQLVWFSEPESSPRSPATRAWRCLARLVRWGTSAGSSGPLAEAMSVTAMPAHPHPARHRRPRLLAPPVGAARQSE